MNTHNSTCSTFHTSSCSPGPQLQPPGAENHQLSRSHPPASTYLHFDCLGPPPPRSIRPPGTTPSTHILPMQATSPQSPGPDLHPEPLIYPPSSSVTDLWAGEHPSRPKPTLAPPASGPRQTSFHLLPPHLSHILVQPWPPATTSRRRKPPAPSQSPSCLVMEYCPAWCYSPTLLNLVCCC